MLRRKVIPLLVVISSCVALLATSSTANANQNQSHGFGFSNQNLISTGTSHSCAMLNDGSVKCWGYNVAGQVGDGTTTTRLSPVSVDLGAGMTAVSINAGYYHSCAVLNDGSVKCWGDNSSGQVGDGSTTDRTSSTAVDLGAGITAMSISGGDYHTCAVITIQMTQA